MKPVCLLILASLVGCISTACGGQSIPDEDGTNPVTIDDIILRRAKSLLLRSILQMMQEDDRNEGSTSQTEWVTKRQHPGKRYGDNLEKRQHPGRREEDGDEQYFDFQKRQHPGRRTVTGHVSETPVLLLSELSKRQHPGKRYLMLHSKRQHPGKRLLEEEEEEEEDGDWDWDADADGDEDVAEVGKRQHPGKRSWHNSSPDLGADSPCDALNPASCGKTSLLLDFLDNINKSRAEEKRQHPGKRLEPEEDSVEGE